MAHTRLLSDPLLLRQVRLQVVLGIVLQLSVQILVLKLDPLFLLLGLALEELAALVPPIVLLNNLGRIRFLLLPLDVQLVKVGLGVEDAGDDVRLEGCLTR